MHRPRPVSIAFFGLSSLVLIGSALALASLWPAGLASARHQSMSLVREAAGAGPDEAALDYRLATWLDPANAAAYLGTARTQIAAGHAETALAALDHAGGGSEVAQLRIRTLIELGRTNEAANRAAGLLGPGRTESDIVLAGLSYALAGRSSDTTALIPLVTSPQAAQRLVHAASGDVPLAGELYASGLTESSRALLVTLPTSFERNLLLGRIYYDRHTTSDLSTATDYLTSAVTLNPANLEAHQLLAAVYTDRGLTAGATAQSILATKLLSGKP